MPGRVKQWDPKALERAARQLMAGTRPEVVAKSHSVGQETLVRNVFIHMAEADPSWADRYTAQCESQKRRWMALIRLGWEAIGQTPAEANQA